MHRENTTAGYIETIQNEIKTLVDNIHFII